jgi:hypothetical protein
MGRYSGGKLTRPRTDPKGGSERSRAALVDALLLPLLLLLLLLLSGLSVAGGFVPGDSAAWMSVIRPMADACWAIHIRSSTYRRMMCW